MRKSWAYVYVKGDTDIQHTTYSNDVFDFFNYLLGFILVSKDSSSCHFQGLKDVLGS